MATIRCKCGTILRDDDPEHSFLLFKYGEYDVDVDSALLRGRAREVWGCPNCGRLWVFWEPAGPVPTEYIPVHS